MGCGMSTEDKEGRARNEEIENQLRRDRMMQRNEIKMLLLGKFWDSPIVLVAALLRHLAIFSFLVFTTERGD